MNAKRTYQLLFGVIGSLGAFMMMDAVEYGPINYTEMIIAGVLAVTGVSGLVGIDYFVKKKIPKDAKPKLKDMESKWWKYYDYQFDLPWWFILFLGVTAELAFLRVFQYFILILFIYVTATFVAFRLMREKFHMTLSATALLFFTCVLTAPFSAAALQQPEFLASIFGFAVPTAREATALLFVYFQAALILSSAMLITHTWRLGLLRKNKLDGLAMGELVSKIIQSRYNGKDFETTQDINQDVPLIIQSFSQGNSALTISLGWSAIYRGLDILSKKKTRVEQSEEVGINVELFKAAKLARDTFAHGHYTPTLDDSLNTLKVLRLILEKLSLKTAQNAPRPTLCRAKPIKNQSTNGAPEPQREISQSEK